MKSNYQFITVFLCYYLNIHLRHFQHKNQNVNCARDSHPIFLLLLDFTPEHPVHSLFTKYFFLLSLNLCHTKLNFPKSSCSNHSTVNSGKNN